MLCEEYPTGNGRKDKMCVAVNVVQVVNLNDKHTIHRDENALTVSDWANVHQATSPAHALCVSLIRKHAGAR